MNPNTVYKRSEKGEEEIRSRKYGIEQHLRQVLIFVDGKASIAKLLDKGCGGSSIVPCLETLASQGFVLVDQVATISCVKGALIAAARQILGYDAEKIVSKIEDAPDTQEGLEATVRNCRKLARFTIDEKKSDDLQRTCSEILAGL